MIMLELWAETQLGNGSFKDTLLSSIPVWAEVRKKSGYRAYEGHHVQEGEAYEITFRANNLKVDTTWKVMYNGKRMTITSAERVQEKHFKYKIIAEVK